MKIKKTLLGTSILWIPMLAIIIAENITKILSMDFIINCVYIAIPVAIAVLIKMDINDIKERRK